MTDEAGQAALDALREQFAEISRIIAAIEDPQAAFELATQLRDLEREHSKLASAIRARQAGRIWDSEKMSLTELARRTNSTKSGAQWYVEQSANQEEAQP